MPAIKLRPNEELRYKTSSGFYIIFKVYNHQWNQHTFKPCSPSVLYLDLSRLLGPSVTYLHWSAWPIWHMTLSPRIYLVRPDVKTLVSLNLSASGVDLWRRLVKLAVTALQPSGGQWRHCDVGQWRPRVDHTENFTRCRFQRSTGLAVVDHDWYKAMLCSSTNRS